MSARLFLRRALPVIGVVTFGFAVFVWYSTTQLQRGANDMLAAVRSIRVGDEALSKALELRRRYPRQFVEKNCKDAGRCFSFYSDNIWMRRLHLAPAKGAVGSLQVDQQGRLRHSSFYACEFRKEGWVIGFTVSSLERNLPNEPIFVHYWAADEVMIWLTPGASEMQRQIAYDVDISFLSKRGQQLNSLHDVFRQDLRKLKE
jgi:hypothetical protein